MATNDFAKDSLILAVDSERSVFIGDRFHSRSYL